MGYTLFATFLCGLLLLPLHPASAATAEVHTVDDKTLSGRLVSVADGSVTLDVSRVREKPQPTTLPLSDVAQVVLREAPRPKPAEAAPAPADNAGTERRRSPLDALFSMFASSPAEPAAAPPAGDEKLRPAATQPATDLTWQVRLVNGDMIHARIAHWAGPTLKLKLVYAMAQETELPRDQVAQLWCGSGPTIAKAVALYRSNGADDIAFVQKGADIIPVNGQAIGIEGDALKFRYDQTDRKIATSRLVGIILAAGRPPDDAIRFHQRVALDNNDQVSGAWTGVSDGAVVLRTSWAPALRLPLRSIYTIDFVNGRQVYLSDLTPVKIEQTPFLGRVIPFRLDASLTGGPLNLGNATYAKGIAVHSRCVLQYDTGGAYERFRCRLGFEQPAGHAGRVAVRVLAGDRVLFEDADLRGDQPPVDLDLDVTGQRRLTLEVGFGKGQDVAGRVIWGNARLLRARLPDEGAK